MTFEGTVKGRQMTFTGTAIGPNPWQMVTLDADVAGTYVGTAGTLSLSKLKVASDALQFDLTRPLEVKGFAEGQKINVTAHGKGAANLQRVPAHLLFAPPDATMGGIVSFEGAVSGGVGDLRGNINASISQFVMQRPQGPSAFGSPTFSAQADADGSFRVNLDASTMQIASQGSGTRTPTPLRIVASGRQDSAQQSINVSSLEITGSGIRKATGSFSTGKAGHNLVLDSDLNIAELSSTWLTLLGSNIKGTGSGKLNVQLSLPGEGTEQLRRGKGRWTASIDQVTAGSFDLRALNFDGTIADGIAQITRGVGTLNGGSVGISGQADFRNAQPIWQGSVEANQVALKEELRPAIARVLPIFAGLGVNAGGVLSGKFDLAARGKSDAPVAEQNTLFDFATLNGNGNLGLSGAFIEGGPLLQVLTQIAGIPPRLDLNAFDGKFLVENGKVKQNVLISTAQKLDLKLTGTTSLNGDLDYTLGIRLTGESNEKWQRYASLVSSDGFLPLSMKGTVTNPGVPLPDPGKLIQGAAENLIKKGLGELFGGRKKEEKNAPAPEKN
jgi:hypothetical protein